MALAQKLGGEEYLELGILGAYVIGVANGDSGLNDYGDIGIKFLGEVEYALDARGVKIVRDIVVVGRRRDDDIVCIDISLGGVGGRPQRGGTLRQIVLDIRILNRGDAFVDIGDPVLVDIDGNDIVVLGQQAGKRKANIAKACDGDVHRCPPAKSTHIRSHSGYSMTNLTALFAIDRVDAVVCTRFSRSRAVEPSDGACRTKMTRFFGTIGAGRCLLDSIYLYVLFKNMQVRSLQENSRSHLLLNI